MEGAKTSEVAGEQVVINGIRVKQEKESLSNCNL